MFFSTLRRTLAHAADRVQVEVFEGEEHARRVRAALDQYNAWHQRECPLKAPLVLGFVLSMVLHRSVSIANLVRRLLGRFRSHGFEVGLGSVTPEAMCHARARLGFEPLAAYFAATAEEIDPAPSLAGRRVWAVDAVTFTAQDTPSNLACFGRPKSVVGKVAFLPFKVVAW